MTTREGTTSSAASAQEALIGGGRAGLLDTQVNTAASTTNSVEKDEKSLSLQTGGVLSGAGGGGDSEERNAGLCDTEHHSNVSPSGMAASSTKNENRLPPPATFEISSAVAADNEEGAELDHQQEREEEGMSSTNKPQSPLLSSSPIRSTAVMEFLEDWMYTSLVGFLVVTFWRGTWVLLDIWTCDQPGTASLRNGESFCFGGLGYVQEVRHRAAWQSYLAGELLFILGAALILGGTWRTGWTYLLLAPRQLLQRLCGNRGNISLTESFRNAMRRRHARVTKAKAVLRALTVYILGVATCCIWRGIWYWIDYYLMSSHENITASWWTSTTVGLGLMTVMFAGASVLAPPAIFLLDGPGQLPPPLVVTILQSYRGIKVDANDSSYKPDRDPYWVTCFDVFASYIVLPWGVVGFWRGFWYLMDWYLWGLTTSARDLRLSLFYSSIIAYGCLLTASEDVVQHFPTPTTGSPVVKRVANEVFMRLRTLLLAIGAVNFWRAVWILWDEWFGETHTWSAALSHILGVSGLLTLGCLSCISAPPSTLGVDALASPGCCDEPLFHNVPVPAEALHWLGIASQPVRREEMDLSAMRGNSMLTIHTAGSMERRNRLDSDSTSLLSKRHYKKRERSQFFRSR